MISKLGTVRIVLDSQAGSCGKGKVVDWFASQYDRPFIAINNFMSNAGHTTVVNGEATMVQHLPTSILNLNATLIIGPGSAITPSILADEIIKYKDILGDRKVYVHPRAAVILNHHCEYEKKKLKSGSTFKGCGAALADKAMRQAMLFWDLMEELHLYREYPEHGYLGITVDQGRALLENVVIQDYMDHINASLDIGTDVIIEGSQGTDLDINYGLNYPHTTSRQCHAGQLLADCGISPTYPNIEVYMVMRPYPIRISSSTNLGDERYSGDYDGSNEISWDQVKAECGAPDEVEFGEQTTVTKKTRRVFEMNWNRLDYVAKLNRPTGIFINFAQYIDWKMLGRVEEITGKTAQFMKTVTNITGCPVIGLGTGAERQDMIVTDEKAMI